jgi:hypothetical protein
MQGNLIENITLKNGLILQMFDLSKNVAGNRWLVSFEARIEVEVKPEYFAGHHPSAVPFENIRALVGNKAIYHYKKERNFIDEKEKDEVLNRLKVTFLDTSLGYLSSTVFPRKLILRKYEEAYSHMLSSPISRWNKGMDSPL